MRGYLSSMGTPGHWFATPVLRERHQFCYGYSVDEILWTTRCAFVTRKQASGSRGVDAHACVAVSNPVHAILVMVHPQGSPGNFYPLCISDPIRLTTRTRIWFCARTCRIATSVHDTSSGHVISLFDHSGRGHYINSHTPRGILHFLNKMLIHHLQLHLRHAFGNW